MCDAVGAPMHGICVSGKCARYMEADVMVGFTEFGLPILACCLNTCMRQVLEVRHGAVVGVAELLPALKEAGVPVEQERKDKVGRSRFGQA